MLVMGASTAGDIAASVAAAATVGLLIAAWIGGHIANQQLRGLRQEREDQLIAERRRRVHAHLAQLFDSDFVKMTAEAQRLFKAGKTLDDMAWQALWEQKGDEEKARILAVMNFYEIFAGEYNDTEENLVDQATAPTNRSRSSLIECGYRQRRSLGGSVNTSVWPLPSPTGSSYTKP